jgi:hypothetical protein
MVFVNASKLGRQTRFIQFAKYIAAPGVLGLELAFPLSRWSRSYYDTVHSLFDQRGIEYRLERTKRADTTEFINVDFGRNLEKAEQVAHLILLEVFELAPDSVVRVTFRGISPSDEFIDR